MRSASRGLIAMAVLGAACGGTVREIAPAAPSAAAEPPAGVLRAGFGRRDITPPPGPGLGGGGPEGRPSQGWRARLHARALVLEDRRGEAFAIVVADLPFTSILLHRRVAELLPARVPLGADRLLLAATHTHSGPGHFLDAASYNRQGSSVPGYDPEVLAFLARRIAEAVLDAWETRTAARLAWGETGVGGVTRNRSPGAGGSAPDTTLLMIRVDLRAGGASQYTARGALSLFAIHGTGNSPENDLWDSDIQGRVARRLETHTPGAVHLFANGAEGDVSPVWAPESRCGTPKLRRARLRGSRMPRGWEWVGHSAERRDACVSAGLEGMDSLSLRIAEPAAALFDSLRPDPASDSLLISRAFTTLALTGANAIPGLCTEAEAGAATVAGAEDLPTRYRGWRFIGFIASAFEEGGSAGRRPKGCQAEKQPALWGILRRITGVGRGFPEAAQFAVVRMGELLIAAVPLEATSAAGALFAERVRSAAVAAGAPPERVVLLGLTNGFMQYAATAGEYRAQHYEGASTIYGPGTVGAFAEVLAGLARRLGPYGATSPAAIVDSVVIRPGASRRLLPAAAKSLHIERRITRLLCATGSLVAEWEDVPPGALDPSAQLLLRIERVEAEGARLVAQDDENVEVRSLGSARSGAWRWKASWPGATPGRHRLVLAARPGLGPLSAECVTAEPASPLPRRRTR